MSDYYRSRLSGDRLKLVYDLAPPRVQQYLNAEVEFLLSRLHPQDIVLDLGCGYGRIFPQLSKQARRIVGIDSSFESLLLAREMHANDRRSSIVQMNAAQLGFRDRVFDVVVCIQNGISAFHVDQLHLMRESIRVTKTGGRTLYSTYSEKFWEERLRWFEVQSQAGLLGAIDCDKTHDGVIVCMDGFTATTVSPKQFLSLASICGVDAKIVEVDESSVFCEMIRR